MAVGKYKLAVAYLRRSTKDQTASITEQRKAVQIYAEKNGYQIVREYVDDGISGDATEKRFDFLKMLDDSSSGDFKYILCWDQDRFGRMDSYELGYYIKPLRDNGIRLDTVNQGLLDWESSMGRIMSSLTQEAKNQFLRDLSRNVARGQREAALKGSWLGTAPYGCKIVGEKKDKRLEIDESSKSDVVQRVFREYVSGKPLKAIAERLNNDGIPAPRSNRWRFDTIRSILENRNYTGDTVIGKYAYGKYNVISKDGIQPSEFKGKCTEKSASELIIHPDHHPAIVDRKVFNKTQQMLATRNRVVSRRHSDSDNPYLLTGILRCSRCGSKLHGMTGGKDGKIYYYECAKRKRDLTACEGTNVPQSEVMRSIQNYVTQEFCKGRTYGELLDLINDAKSGKLRWAQLPASFKRLRETLRPEFPFRKKDDRTLTRNVTFLKEKIAKACDNLLELDKKRIARAQTKIEEMEMELARLESQIAQSQVGTGELNDATLELLKAVLVLRANLTKKCKSDTRDKFLGSLKQITVRTHLQGTGNGRRHKLDTLKLEFYRVGLNATDLNPHRPV